MSANPVVPEIGSANVDAGAVISGGHDTAEFKVEFLRSVGIKVADSPAALGEEMLKAMKG